MAQTHAPTGLSPADQVFGIINGMSAASIVASAARLGIAAAVGDEPAAVPDIAARIGADPAALARLMRALATFGIYEKVDATRYAHTEMSRVMHPDHPERLHAKLMTGGDWGWASWGTLTEAVRTGKCPFPDYHEGRDFFTYLAQNPDEQSLVYNGMTAWSEPMHEHIVDALDWNGVGTFADMGGGRGALVRQVLERRPEVSGVLFETAPTLRVVDERLSTGDLAGRCELVAGDFFDEVAFHSDIYLFKLTMHMYDDDDVVRVLRNCAKAARPGARVVVADPLLTDPPREPATTAMDLHMLLVMGGRERGEQDHAAVFERAGLRFRGVTPTGTMLHLAEGEVIA